MNNVNYPQYGQVGYVVDPANSARATFIRNFINGHYANQGAEVDRLIADAKKIFDESVKA